MAVQPGMPDILFSNDNISRVYEARVEGAKENIARIPEEELMAASEEDLTDLWAERICMEPITLHEDYIHVDRCEKTLERNHYHNGIYRIQGDVIYYHIPFSGVRRFFTTQPSIVNVDRPYAYVRDNEIIFQFEIAPGENPDVAGMFKERLDNLRTLLSYQRDDVERGNQEITEAIRASIAARTARIQSTQATVEKLGYPLRVREDSPRTFEVPLKRRRIASVAPVRSAGDEPQPILAEDDYQHILTVMKSMSQVMERSPSAFDKINEEALRVHFLVQLNGHFVGRATGETFNFGGKTDILIADGGRNIFIAECKYWDGEAVFRDTISQLFKYLTWRDTKAAVVIFNRRKNFSAVLEKIEETMPEHPNYKSDFARIDETEFRAVFHHNDDRERDITVTVLAFEVPAAE